MLCAENCQNLLSIELIQIEKDVAIFEHSQNCSLLYFVMVIFWLDSYFCQ